MLRPRSRRVGRMGLHQGGMSCHPAICELRFPLSGRPWAEVSPVRMLYSNRLQRPGCSQCTTQCPYMRSSAYSTSTLSLPGCRISTDVIDMATRHDRLHKRHETLTKPSDTYLPLAKLPSNIQLHARPARTCSISSPRCTWLRSSSSSPATSANRAPACSFTCTSARSQFSFPAFTGSGRSGSSPFLPLGRLLSLARMYRAGARDLSDTPDPHSDECDRRAVQSTDYASSRPRGASRIARRDHRLGTRVPTFTTSAHHTRSGG